MAKFEDLLGKTLTKIEKDKNGEEVILTTNDNRRFKMYHQQDCCENVTVEDIDGRLEDLLNTPILMAEEVSKESEEARESGTWTFYKLATINGYVTIRWYGTSNGYYSEGVSFVEL